MKIYLAGGMTVMNVKGRERELSKKFDAWNRLFSFHFKDLIYKSEILCIIKDEDIHRNNASSNSFES
jgi:hypothetical protein